MNDKKKNKKIDDFIDLINKIKRYFNKVDIKVIYSFIVHYIENNCNQVVKFKNSKYDLLYQSFLMKFHQFIDISFEIKDIKDMIEIHKNNRKIENWMKRLYKLNNLLYPNQQLNPNIEKYTLKNGLYFNHRDNQKLSKNNDCKEILAYDTETYEGKAKLICRNKGKYLFFKENEYSFDLALQFLCYHIRKQYSYRFFWNIDFDIQAILQLYDKDDKIDFIDKLSKGIEMIYINDKKIYKLQWIRGKLFKIKDIKAKRNIFFTDLYTFYNLGLGKASIDYLDENKFDDIDGNLLNTSLEYWNNNEKKIIEYCIQDCKLTMNLGKLLIDSIIKLDLLVPKLLVSPASISKANYRYNNIIPSIKDNVSMKLVQIAYDCYYGGRFELFERGYIKKAFLYDINSQYPNFIKDLPDMRNGVWKIHKNLIELPKERTFGYFLCLLKIPYDNQISTIPNKDGIVRFHNGYAWNWFTWYDIDLMRDYIIKIKKAYIFEKFDNNFKPFYDKTIDLYNKKTELKGTSNKMLYNTVKITLNGIYGCFIERQERFELDNDGNIIKSLKGGILFNPIYASQITAFGRWSVIKDIPKQEWNHIKAIHTDSIIVDKDMSKFLDIGKELGKWTLEGKGKGLLINTGMYQVGKIFKSRGIPKKIICESIKSKTPSWFKFSKIFKNLSSKEFKIKHMKKVREALIQDKNLINMNKMVDITRSINLNSDSKRHWYRDFKNFDDLRKNNIKSLPFYNFKSKFRLNPNPKVYSEIDCIDFDIAKYILKNQEIY